MPNENTLHARTQDAYSFSRYGAEAWMNAIRVLIELYDENEVEWILRSKYMRWAADHFGIRNAALVDGVEALDGLEIILYRDKWGIEIERD